ncbi:hypothetical protein [Ureaplasma urealyticum]|uniref:Uncharacterized protein n=3 Tax=Ureaplasma urealyticum TaxID=2130 RepID=A0AAP9ACH4_UREUR|nr:hypothetical protein [Ureaplasma urealyticum]ACI60220.1 conserved hypothetical protein [Ureaplasma urealyticum serovar 10 str. ATCC 33699]EDT49310.1 conserved hypothetical protein [Ureaplasma urealyticum serovar 13 str. ATCC 33698]EDU05966.1 conserved hypothetical protein [Ureaplasma urealyticum serovar 5 str. ATCC 27817]EDU57052.1 conserved hypothetical protein [Ureaplasma urealyticum serovar 7 str. ATCC 27819]EDU66916.1 conserved hypothetical protein [Ureaplasma urealyticum serovar 11 str
MLNAELSSAQKDLYNSIKSYLNVIFLNQKLNYAIKNDDDYRSQLNKVMNIFEYYEDNYEIANKNFHSYWQAFKSYAHYEKLVDNFDDFDDLKDIVSGLKIYVLNTFQVDLEQESQKIADIDFKYDEKTQASMGFYTTDDQQNSSNPTYENVRAEPVSEENYSNNAYQSASDFTTANIDNLTNMVFSARVLNGEIYLYETKPKVIPFLKYLFFAISLALVLFTALTYAFLMDFGTHMLTVVSVNGITHIVRLTSPTFPTQLVISLFIMIYAGLNAFKRKISENEKFHFKNFIWIILFGALLVVALANIFTGNLRFSSNSFDEMFRQAQINDVLANLSRNNDFSFDYSRLQSVFYGFSISQILVFLVIILGTILIIITFILNPKRDTQRIKLLLQEIHDDILTGKIDPNTYLRTKNPFRDLFGF